MLIFLYQKRLLKILYQLDFSSLFCGSAYEVFLPRSLEVRTVVRSHLEYGMWACSSNLVADTNQRIERLAPRSVTGLRHFPYDERLQRLGLHFLKRQRVRPGLITVFKKLTSLTFLTPTRRGLRGVPYAELIGKSQLGQGSFSFSPSSSTFDWSLISLTTNPHSLLSQLLSLYVARIVYVDSSGPLLPTFTIVFIKSPDL